jgi:hypothetical protein
MIGSLADAKARPASSSHYVITLLHAGTGKVTQGSAPARKHAWYFSDAVHIGNQKTRFKVHRSRIVYQ